MALMRWEPFREIETIRRQMDQLFSDLAEVNRGNSDIFQSHQTAWVPAVELKDTGSELLLRAEVPGVDGKDLNIQVTSDAVLIAGEHRYENRSESQGNFRSEFRYGSFQRVIPLPAKVQNQQVKADLKDGILTLTLPKLQSEHNRVFKVNLGQSQPAAASIEAGNGNEHTNAKSDQTVETA
jgi:HSP20 family protein